MNKMKKIMALALSFMMVVAMNVVTFAAQTFTITAPDTTHQYEIYQIFTGDYSAEKKTLSNIKWGVNGKKADGSAVNVGDKVEESILNELTAISKDVTDTDRLGVVTKYADLTEAPVTTVSNGQKYTAEAGYYLIKDKDGTVSGEDSYTLYLVKVVGDVKIDPKSDVPEVEKKVKDKNDTDNRLLFTGRLSLRNSVNCNSYWRTWLYIRNLCLTLNIDKSTMSAEAVCKLCRFWRVNVC